MPFNITYTSSTLNDDARNKNNGGNSVSCAMLTYSSIKLISSLVSNESCLDIYLGLDTRVTVSFWQNSLLRSDLSVVHIEFLNAGSYNLINGPTKPYDRNRTFSILL